MVIYLIFQEPILTLFGGRVNEQTFSFSREYFFYITLGIPCYIFGQAMNPIIRSDGSPKFAMVSTLAGAVVNLILDPIFLFVFRWGMMGAAVATVLGQILTAALSIWYLCHMKAVRLERKSFGLYGCLMKKFLPLGLTSFLAQISLVISMAAVQNMCTKYGALDPVFGQPEYAQIPLAVLGIVMKFFQIVISISIGMAAASALLSFAREVVFGVGLAILLPLFWGLDGLLYSFPAADILTFLLSVAVIYYTQRILKSGEERSA